MSVRSTFQCKTSLFLAVLLAVAFSGFGRVDRLGRLGLCSLAVADIPISTDSRIKTLIYSENEVFPIVLHYGYQTSLELGKGETIQTYSIGNTYAWQFSVVGRTMFIKPLEENVMTNMTVITNKRRYYFELVSKSVVGAMDMETAYAVRFFYPDDELSTVRVGAKQNRKAENEVVDSVGVDPIQPYNFGYSSKGDKEVLPRTVFDDGNNTYFQYAQMMSFTPVITSANKKDKPLSVRQLGNYFMVNELSREFTLSKGDKKVTVSLNRPR